MNCFKSDPVVNRRASSRLVVLTAVLLTASCALALCAGARSPEEKDAASVEAPATKVVTVNLFYTGKDGSAKRFVEEMERGGVADAIRREPGNLEYEYYISVSDPETVLLIDSWRDQAALDAHHASPMMQTLAGLREKYDLRMRATRYIREEGLPEKDEKFLRR